MLAQADQGNIVYGYFLAKNDYVVWSNISLVVSLCNLSQTYLDNID